MLQSAAGRIQTKADSLFKVLGHSGISTTTPEADGLTLHKFGFLDLSWYRQNMKHVFLDQETRKCDAEHCYNLRTSQSFSFY